MMVDDYKYESYYYVHRTSEDYSEGSQYSDLDDATENAKDFAAEEACEYEITHIMERVIKKVRVHIEVEDA